MTNKKENQDAEIDNFQKQYNHMIKGEEIEEFMQSAIDLGKKLELAKIQQGVVNDTFMKKIDFSDPINMKSILPLLSEFVFYCSNPDSESLDTVKPKKSIPISSFKDILFKIIENREADSIDDILKDIVSLIFVIDEQHEAESACENAMGFVRDLLKESSNIQYQVAFGIRLMAVLINSRYVPNGDILDIFDPGKFQEPYVRKNQYIAIREIFSRAGNQEEGSNTNFRQIPYIFFSEHESFCKLIDIIVNRVSLMSSYEKLHFYNYACEQKEQFEKEAESKKSKSDTKIEIKKWNNIIIVEWETTQIYEFDQWVQCQYILLIPYIYEIKKHNHNLKIKDNFFRIKNLESLSWNVQITYLNMLRTSVDLLNQSGPLLFEFYLKSEQNSDFQTTVFLTIIDLFKNNEKSLKNNKYIKSFLEPKIIKNPNSEAAESVKFFKEFIETSQKVLNKVNDIINNAGKEDAKFEADLNYVFKVIPILTWILKYYLENPDDENENKNKKKSDSVISNINKILIFMTKIPIVDRPNCCKIFLDPFFICLPYKIKGPSSTTDGHIKKLFDMAQNALRILMSSKDDFDDRLFFIKMINYFYESENDVFKKDYASFIMLLIDLIANDPVYIVRSEATQTVLNLLVESSFTSTFDYIQQVFPGASLNGKKSLLSLIASIISVIDPFEKPEDKDELFETYINDVFEVIGNNKNKDLRQFFKDILKTIWALLPEKTQNLIRQMRI